MLDIGIFKVVFDDDYQYVIQMELMVIVDYFDKVKILFVEELMRNILWKCEQVRQIGIFFLFNDLSWMNLLLLMVVLSMVLNKSQFIIWGEVENGVVVFYDVLVLEVMELVLKVLVNMLFVLENNVLMMFVNDENDMLFFVKVSCDVGFGLCNYLVDVCIEELKGNFKFVCENDFGFDDIKVNMVKVNVWFVQ